MASSGEQVTHLQTTAYNLHLTFFINIWVLLLRKREEHFAECSIEAVSLVIGRDFREWNEHIDNQRGRSVKIDQRYPLTSACVQRECT